MLCVLSFLVQRACDSLELAEPRVGHDGSQDGRQVAQSHEGVVDGGGEVIVPPQEVLKVQDQHGCTREQRRIHTGSRVYTEATPRVRRLTSHPIVGETLAELVDHDKEDADRVAAHSGLLKGKA